MTFYFKENILGFMIILGKDGRTKIEGIRNELSYNELSYDVIDAYNKAPTFTMENGLCLI